MDKNITEALEVMKELSQRLATLITKEVAKETAAVMPTAARLGSFVSLVPPTSEPAKLIIRPATPAVTVVKAPVVAAAEKVDKATLSPENQKVLEELLKTCKHQSEFTDKCREKFGWKRSEARQCYHDRKPKAAKPAAPAAPVAPTPVVVPIAATAAATAKLPTFTTVTQLDSKGVDGKAKLELIEKDAREIYKNMGQIPAIKFIRDNTGLDLLQSKEWVDMFDDPAKPEPAALTAAKQDFIRRTGDLPKSVLNAQVQATRQDGIKKAMDGDKGQAVKQLKIDIAGDNKQMLVQAARRIARDLGKNGPITVDNVTAEMAKTYNVVAAKGKRQNWKGSIFTKTEWVFIGNMASTQVTSHGRPVGMWALKTWLAENTVNGKETNISSFVITRLYRDFKHAHPKAELKNCNCYLGEERLAAEIRDTIVKGGNRLYEIPVTWIPASIGAVIVPPATKLLA